MYYRGAGKTKNFGENNSFRGNRCFEETKTSRGQWRMISDESRKPDDVNNVTILAGEVRIACGDVVAPTGTLTRGTI